MKKKEISKPYDFLKEKRRKIIKIDKAIWDKMNWRAKKALIHIAEIINKEDIDDVLFDKRGRNKDKKD